MKCINLIAFWLVIIGAINWGLIGTMDFNLVSYIFGVGSATSKLVYSVVGLSGVYNGAVTLAKYAAEKK
ncbi:DUF378 domain-containing protein [Rickettsiales endosymbiont of Stachyamoeba lipophora]|uniref:DUF378 domain-containing protein n=1 Tax=Rickettsiales endosymbiont of Stachyamoeba lipophora TaxID=2486578 RepID=UPI000F6534EB|nr:DUF378 domain-containing protein [Rickettsiales endosymbiont of Stachyamoeba lipophora]AZL16139.1 DUF378 domain-containing protein [Rickettsiales endosymbiont of Stachyamoeba lipophora]